MRRLRKTKFIVFTSPRDRGHGILCRATWENTGSGGVVRREKTGTRQRFRPEPLLGFLGKGRQGNGNSIGPASLKNYGGLWAIGMVSSCLVSDPRIIEAEEYCLLGYMGQIEEIRLWTG